MAQMDYSIDVNEILSHLSDWDPRRRHQAREKLVSQGDVVLPILIEKLSARDWHIRWEAAKALGEIGSSQAAQPLVALLQDEDTGVRWAAMSSLITLGRAAVQPVLLGLTRSFQSSRYRQGAHHVLHSLYNQGLLTPVEVDVYHALEGVMPGILAAQLANQALISEYPASH